MRSLLHRADSVAISRGSDNKSEQSRWMTYLFAQYLQSGHGNSLLFSMGSREYMDFPVCLYLVTSNPLGLNR